MSDVAIDYGWHDAAPCCSTAYVKIPVLKELKRIGAKRVLDVGCGNGSFSHLLQKEGFQVFGCDSDAKGIEFANRTQSGARFAQVGLYDPPELLKEKDFDAVVSTEVIEHLFDPGALPRFAAKVLKPDGLLILSTPYNGWLKNVIIAVTGHFDEHHGPLHVGGHIKFWSIRTLTRLLDENGFAVEQFFGAGRLPYIWKSMVLSARMKKS